MKYFTKSSSTTHYSSESFTTEIEDTPKKAKCLMATSIVVQLASSLIAIILSAISLTMCRTIQFSGIAPILGVILLCFQALTAYFIHTRRQMMSFALAVFCFPLTLITCLNEFGGVMCTMTFYHSYAFCSTFRTKFDMCQWLMSWKMKLSIIAESTTLGTQIYGFAWGRIILLVLAVLSLIACVVIFVFLSVSVKVGKPVYLNRKRHRKSIVVGRRRNAEIANRNRTANVTRMTKTTEAELKTFEEKRLNIIKRYFGDGIIIEEKSKLKTNKSASTVSSSLEKSEFLQSVNP